MPGAGPVEDKFAPGVFVRGVFRAAALMAILAAGAGIGYRVWDSIRLPFHNPLNVVGPLAREGFNPANNSVRFCIFILLPAVLLAAIGVVRSGPINRFLFAGVRAPGPATDTAAPRAVRAALFVAVLAFSGLVSLSVPTYHASGAFDTFHEGESLGMAVSLDHGMAPYKDFIFLHGLFQDPYRSSLAFRLFGKSIGAVRTLESLLKVASWILLAVVVILLFDRDYRLAVPALAALALMQREFSTFFYRHLIDKSFVCYPPVLIILPPRDVALLLFLLTVMAVHTLGKRGSRNALAIGALGSALAFLPAGAFAYSVDRGFYLSAAFAFAAPVLYWMHFTKPPGRWVFPTSCGVGFAAAIAVLAYMLRGQFGPFVDFVFFTMPRYKELSDGHVYPISFIPYLRVALVYAFATLWLAGRFLSDVYCERGFWRGTGTFLMHYFIESVVLLVAVCCYRSALGRSDWEHIAYSSLPVYLLAFTILGKHIIGPYIRGARGAWIQYVTLGALAIGCIVLADDVRRSGSADANFPYKTQDDKFIGPQYRDAIAYLKANLGPGEKVFTLTSEASWYYFLDQPSPARFPVVWFATPPSFQKKIVEDLPNEKVKYVIYRSGYPDIDEISHEERYPILMDYIKTHYKPDQVFQNIEIWVRVGVNTLQTQARFGRQFRSL